VRRIACLLGTVAVLAAGGCAQASSAPTPVDRVAAARALVPAELRQAKELVVGTDPTFQPMTYLDGNQHAGMDVDLGNAIAERLGLRLRWTTVAFGELIDQTASHKIDLLMTSMFDKVKRQDRVDFLDYLYVGTSIVVPHGVGDVGGLRGLCGRTVAVQADTVYVDMVQQQRQRCASNAPLTSITVSTDPVAEITAGRADTALNDYPIAVFDVGRAPSLEISGRQIEALPYGIGIAKDRKGLTMAFQAALYLLIDDGTYDKLLAKWNLPEGGLRTGTINGGA
jgi:polar amino acid transport system substrate-binding protein